jgi:hypothetical protein
MNGHSPSPLRTSNDEDQKQRVEAFANEVTAKIYDIFGVEEHNEAFKAVVSHYMSQKDAELQASMQSSERAAVRFKEALNILSDAVK